MSVEESLYRKYAVSMCMENLETSKFNKLLNLQLFFVTLSAMGGVQSTLS